MSNPKTQKEYDELFWRFINSEIPNIIQILTLPSLLGILIKNTAHDPWLFIITTTLLAKYLGAKTTQFINGLHPITTNDPLHPDFTKPLLSRLEVSVRAFNFKNSLVLALLITGGTAIVIAVVRSGISR